MSIRTLSISSAVAVLLAACSPWQAPLTTPDPLARLRGRDAYGLVTKLASTDITPDMRDVERCVNRDEVCEVLLSEGGRYQYASVALSGQLAIDRIVVVKGQARVGDIVRFDLPRDRRLVPMSVEVASRAAKRKGSDCDWVDGTPETKTGGIVCGRWSYKDGATP